MNILNPNIKKIGKESLFLHADGHTPRIGEGSFIRLCDQSIMFAYISFVEKIGTITVPLTSLRWFREMTEKHGANLAFYFSTTKEAET